MRVGVIFPGQGSQVVGMGVDVAQGSAAAREIFERSSSVLGYDLLEVQRDGPEVLLRETRYSQPAIFATNIALYAAARDVLDPVVSAGHSFGELCSLTIADSLSLESAVEVVDARARAMQHAAEMAPGGGGMSAVLGMDGESIRRIVEETTARGFGRVQLANFNAPSQIVISGDLAAVKRAGDALLEAGAKRVVALNVSGAWHSALMDPAVAPFEAAVREAEFVLPSFDVISNVDARTYRDTETIRRNLVGSITREVRWHDAALELLAYGLDMVLEFGATPVLGPLLRRLPGVPAVVNVCDYAAVESLKASFANVETNA